MKFDLGNLQTQVERFYRFFRDTLKFSLPGSICDKYKMMVMVNYSLEGTAYGGTYDDFIGALWVTPNRIQDQNSTVWLTSWDTVFSFRLWQTKRAKPGEEVASSR